MARESRTSREAGVPGDARVRGDGGADERMAAMNEQERDESEKVSILLVDDQPARLMSYEVILGALGQNLVRAASGAEALERLMKEEFAVVLLDVSMPEMDGFETAALIHEHPRFERTPIVFVTGYQITDFDRLRGYELGAVDYVFVPVVPEILRSKVSVFVELHQQRRELQALNRRLEAANAELAIANSTLEAEKTRELQALNRTLEQANAELAHANATLEAEVIERSRLEEAMRATDRRKDEFLMMLAHELRNPLAPIVSALEIMRMKTLDDPQLVWCREVMERQTQHLTRLVEDLLDVSRITQGQIPLQKSPVEIATVIDRALEVVRPLIDASRHRLTVERPGHPIRVEGDATRLAQAIGNLLSNAAKYTEDGGQIRVLVEESKTQGGPPEVIIRVRDTGVGIAPEMLPRVFELFTQGQHTLDRAQGGLGIGLTLVKRLIEVHGGSVTAHSDGPGKGSEFVIRLPMFVARPAEARPAPGAAGSPASPTAQRVLVVDDNVDAARSLALLLEASGNVVEIAYDGNEAVSAAIGFHPDVVLLDIGMPNLDGFGAARWIRAQPWARNVLLVAVTGWPQEDVRAGMRESGFDAHMVKPVEFAALTALFAKLPSANRSSLVQSQ